MKKHQVLVAAERTGYESKDDILEWLDYMKQHLHDLKKELKENKNKKPVYERKSKLFKLNTTASSAVAWKLMNWYLGRYERELETRKREALMKMAEEQYDDDSDVYELDSNGDCMSDNMSRRSSLGEMVDQKRYIRELEDQKRAVVGEIQRLYREGNCKRQAVMMLAGLTKAMDPIAKRGVKKLETVRQKIQPIKKSITDEDLKR